MKLTNINQELLKAIKSPGANLDNLLTDINNQEKQQQTINKLDGKIDLDPSIYKGGQS